MGRDRVSGFDAAGDQIPELQGPLTPELRAELERRADGATAWHGFGGAPLVWDPASLLRQEGGE